MLGVGSILLGSTCKSGRGTAIKMWQEQLYYGLAQVYAFEAGGSESEVRKTALP